MLGATAVNPILFAVGGSDVPAEIGPINLNLALQVAGVRLHGPDRLTDFVRQDERGFILDVQIAGELQGRVALGSVHEDGNGQKIVANRQLPAGKDRPRGDGELPAATLALVEVAGGDEAGVKATAMGANRLTIGLIPPDAPEGIARLLLCHSGDLRQ